MHRLITMYFLLIWSRQATSYSNTSICKIFENVYNLPLWFDCDIDPCIWSPPNNEIQCVNGSQNISHISINNYPEMSGSLSFDNNTQWPKTLQYLQITNTNLTGTFSTTSRNEDTPLLEYVNITQNNFNELLELDTSTLPNLKTFDASWNQFTSFAANIVYEIDSLLINNNMIDSEIPPHLETESIRRLDMSNNQFYGTIRTGNSHITSYIDASNNRLTGIEIEAFPANLTQLDVSMNEILHGLDMIEMFPDTETNWPQFKLFNLSNNLFYALHSQNYHSVPKNSFILDLRNNPLLSSNTTWLLNHVDDLINSSSLMYPLELKNPLEAGNYNYYTLFEDLPDNVTLMMDVQVQCAINLCSSNWDSLSLIPLNRDSNVCTGYQECINTCRCANVTTTSNLNAYTTTTGTSTFTTSQDAGDSDVSEITTSQSGSSNDGSNNNNDGGNGSILNDQVVKNIIIAVSVVCIVIILLGIAFKYKCAKQRKLANAIESQNIKQLQISSINSTSHNNSAAAVDVAIAMSNEVQEGNSGDRTQNKKRKHTQHQTNATRRGNRSSTNNYNVKHNDDHACDPDAVPIDAQSANSQLEKKISNNQREEHSSESGDSNGSELFEKVVETPDIQMVRSTSPSGGSDEGLVVASE